ncbi:DEAD/DEAH box helicase [Spirochaetia bacterium]|nr:DEAD/DEAH box helicase [Spirochaetia bacterium]
MSISFETLGVNSPYTARLAERGIAAPTEIQAQVIPRLLTGQNTLFRSATGTGKTFAYLIPLFQTLLAEPPKAWPVILVCAPTYELCSQIKAEADYLLASPPNANRFKAGLIIGAAAMGRQIDGLKKDKPAVVIGNPGRVLQLARMGKLKLGRTAALVLDEGDRLVADELFAETRELAALVTGRRITAACSATLSPKSRERLLPLLGEEPATEERDDSAILRDRIEHWAIFSEDRRKITTLRSFLAAARPRKALVFTGRGGDVGNIVSQLQFHHIGVQGLYGDLDKKNRKQALDDFRRDRVHVLITTDLAARGLDIPGISHIIALDVPAEGDPYIHRAGRTGRAGKTGIMVSIGDEDEMRRLAGLEKRLGIIVYPKELYQGRVVAPEPLE